MNAIEIILTGVIYLLGSTEASKPVDVIIPNVSMPSAPYGHVLTDHYAYVKVRKADIESCTSPCLRDADFHFKKADGTTEFVLYALHGDQITLSDNLTPNPLEICIAANCGKKLSEVQPGESDDLVSYHSIPSKTDVCGSCGPLRGEYLTSKNGDLVAARMTLNRGKLSAANRDTEEWQFLPSRFKFANVNYHHQLVADQAVLSAEATGSVTLKVTPLVGDDDIGSHTLTLVLKSTAQIEIGNLMPSDLVPMGHHAPEAVDVHFATFYRMMTDPVPSDPPIPHRTKFPDSDPGGPRANCIPLRGTQ